VGVVINSNKNLGTWKQKVVKSLAISDCMLQLQIESSAEIATIQVVISLLGNGRSSRLTLNRDGTKVAYGCIDFANLVFIVF